MYSQNTDTYAFPDVCPKCGNDYEGVETVPVMVETPIGWNTDKTDVVPTDEVEAFQFVHETSVMEATDNRGQLQVGTVLEELCEVENNGQFAPASADTQ